MKHTIRPRARALKEEATLAVLEGGEALQQVTLLPGQRALRVMRVMRVMRVTLRLLRVPLRLLRVSLRA